MKDRGIVRDDVQKCFIKGQGRVMRELWKDTQSKTLPSTLIAKMTVGDKKEWRKISCPLTAEPYSRCCGEACAWYSEQSNSIPTMAPPAVEVRYSTVTVVRCKGEPIGKLIDTTNEKDFGDDDEKYLQR